MHPSVLVVDDEAAVRYSITRILGEAGFNVQTADSGASCLSALRQGFKGLILMDIVMPGMSGWDTIQAILDEHLYEGNILCMLTGKEVPDARMDSFKEYVLDYIIKPFDSGRLVTLVRDYCAYLP
jgi:DNA-binding NtrC family response regulator